MAHHEDCPTCAASQIPHAPPPSSELVAQVRALLGDRLFAVVLVRKDPDGRDVAECLTNIASPEFIARTLLRGATMYAPQLFTVLAMAGAKAGEDDVSDDGQSN